MSSTRSPSPKAPATRPAALIVSHGQPSDPAPAEAALAQLAARVTQLLPGWHLGSATLATPGALARALETVGPAPLIYPLFMTQGWFTAQALKERLQNAGARPLLPFGCDPGLPDMAAALLRDVLAERGWQAGQTRLFLAAHGSGRSPNAARDTHRFAAALAGRIGLAEIRVGFVEEAPYLAETAADIGAQAICLPFFAARGGHVTDDLPAALEEARFKGVCLDPIGCAPGAPALMARTLQSARVAA